MEKKVTLKFVGEEHKVDVKTFSDVVLAYSLVLEHAAKDSNVLNPVKIYIQANEPGSLDVVLSIATQAVSGAIDFLSTNRDGIEAAVILAGAFYGFKKKIAGKTRIKVVSEQDGNNLTVEADGENIRIEKNVYNFFVQNPDISERVNKSFETLTNNPDVTGLEIMSHDVPTVSVRRSEFSGIASSPIRETMDVRFEEVDVVLTVVKPCLVSANNRRWEFLHEGEKVSAVITDQTFLENLDSCSFSKGTIMQVRLRIEQEFVEEYKAYKNKSYTIVHVYGVINEAETEGWV